MTRIRYGRGGLRSSRTTAGPTPRPIASRRSTADTAPSGDVSLRPTPITRTAQAVMTLRGLSRALPVALLLALLPAPATAENGYDLWLRYHPIADGARLSEYRTSFSELVIDAASPTLTAARAELTRGLSGLLDRELRLAAAPTQAGALIAGTPAGSSIIAGLGLASELEGLGREGYLIRSVEVDGRRATVIAGNDDVGVLYGAFHLLRLLQTHQPAADLRI